MKITRTLVTVAVSILFLGFLHTAVLAHGTEKHEYSAKTTVKEQKPWGIAGDAKQATRKITIKMGDDMRFSPDKLDITQGETVQFTITNAGKLMHEFVIGTKPELDKHALEMIKNPGMEHDEPYMAHVAPGKTGSLVWQFNRAGEFDFACLIAGHYQAGMVGKLLVKAKPGQTSASATPEIATSAPVASAASPSADDWTMAEVRKTDAPAGRITLRHEPIKNLDMDGMTMVFRLKDTKLIEGVKAEDKVRFRAIKQNGLIVVTDIELIKP